MTIGLFDIETQLDRLTDNGDIDAYLHWSAAP